MTPTTIEVASSAEMSTLVAARGPRWAVTAKASPNRHVIRYCETAETAEEKRREFLASNYYMITVRTPVVSADFAALRAEREEAQAALADVMDRIRAGVATALAAGRSEVEVARCFGVDRMTVRKWAGK